MASYARSLDAFVISRNNSFFVTKLPRGYLSVKELPLEQLRYGLMDICGQTYFREKFLNSFNYVETGKEPDELHGGT